MIYLLKFVVFHRHMATGPQSLLGDRLSWGWTSGIGNDGQLDTIVYNAVIKVKSLRKDLEKSCVSSVAFREGSDWWFGTLMIFPYIGNNHPNWLIFFRGVAQPPTRIKIGDDTKFTNNLFGFFRSWAECDEYHCNESWVGCKWSVGSHSDYNLLKSGL